jgi:tetratricopeptide (TPR) repeat protein
MKKLLIIVTLVLIIFSNSNANNKKNKETAKKLCQDAMELMNSGKFQDAISLLDSAMKLDPEPLTYPYERALSYFKMAEWDKAVILFDSLRTHPQVNDQVYQMLGNAMEAKKNYDDAISVFNAGLKKFPNSGRLYLCVGSFYFEKDELEKMVYYFLKGTNVEPNFGMNYFNLAQYYKSNSKKVWALYYYEIFLNLSNNIRKMTDACKSIFKIYIDIFFGAPSDNLAERVGYDFVGKVEVDSIETKERNEFILAYQNTVNKIKIVKLPQEAISLKIMDIINFRISFLNLWFSDKMNEKYPTVLFPYQKKLLDAGYFIPYHYWLLKETNTKEYEEWVNNNKPLFKKFLDWQEKNPLEFK